MPSLVRRGWTPLRLPTRRRLRDRPASAEVGRWDQFVDKGPTGSRSYAVYTPPGLSPGTAVPLIVVLHGCNQSCTDAAPGTEASAYADRAGGVAACPEQSAKDDRRRFWSWLEPRFQTGG